MTTNQLEQRIKERSDKLQGKEPVRILHYDILVKVNKLPLTDRLRFIQSMAVIDTLPKEIRQKEMLQLLTTLFMNSSNEAAKTMMAKEPSERNI